ncbi:MAG: LysM peptidoglycan-binding domain-containing protein [Clostridia bacterium]|nr:LysM peptidoglycan-binding domain-containing protein [Clostridia bacterium]
MSNCYLVKKKVEKHRAVRRLLLILAISLVFNLILGVSSFFKSDAVGNTVQSYELISVQDGDTLWSIATKYKSEDDPRAIIYNIKKINHLDQSAIYPGQTLKIPISYR